MQKRVHHKFINQIFGMNKSKLFFKHLIMRQLITIGSGSFGVRVSLKLYENYLEQHQLDSTGKPNIQQSLIKAKDKQSLFNYFSEHGFRNTVFNQSQNGKYTPRCIFADLQPDPICQMQSSLKQLVSSEQIIYSKDGGSGNYMRGHYTIAKQIMGDSFHIDKKNGVIDCYRKQAQKCDNLSGFVFNTAFEGGTAGLSTLIAQRMSVDFPKKNITVFGLLPSTKFRNGPVSIYNTLLGLTDIRNHYTMMVMYDNQQLYRVCQDELNIESPTYNQVNQLIANSISWTTWGQRFGVNNSSLAQLETSLVNYKRMNNIMPSMSHYRTSHSQLSAESYSNRKQTTTQMIRKTMKQKNLMFTTNLSQGLYSSVSLQFRGNISPLQINNSLKTFNTPKQFKFAQQIQRFKIGFNMPEQASKYFSLKQKGFPCVLNLLNHTSFKNYLQKLCTDFDQIYYKRAFVHWYVGEGLSQGFFHQARQENFSLAAQYRQFQEWNMQRQQNSSVE